jgi:hypothetical protein
MNATDKLREYVGGLTILDTHEHLPPHRLRPGARHRGAVEDLKLQVGKEYLSVVEAIKVHTPRVLAQC